MFLSLYVKARTFAADLRDKIMPEDGAVATEYGLLLVLIALAIITAATALGLAIKAVFNNGATTLGGTPGA